MRDLAGWRRLAGIGILSGAAALLAPPTDTLASDPPILGRITDSRGVVVADAMVFLTPVNHPNGDESISIRAVRTDRNGAFYAFLPAGRYRVAAVKPGFDVAMTDVYSRVRGVLILEMSRTSGRSQDGDWRDTPQGKLGSGWILRQQRDNVLRAERPGMDDRVVLAAEKRPVGHEGWAAALFEPLDGHFVQQFSGGPSLADQGESALGRITGLSLEGVLVEDVRWRFDGWSGRTLDAVDAAGSRLENRQNRAAVGFDYQSDGRDSFTGDLSYGARRYSLEPGAGMPPGIEQTQKTVALRSRWERQLDGDATLFTEGRYFESGARPSDRSAADGTYEDRYFRAATGLALRSGDHRIDLGLTTEQYDYSHWTEGEFLSGNPNLPGPGIEPGAGPAFSLTADDRWQTGDLAEVSYGLLYQGQPQAGGSYAVPRVGVSLTPAGGSGLVVRSEVLYLLQNDASSGRPVDDRLSRGESDRLGYLVGIERRPSRPDDSLHVAASYSFRPMANGGAAVGMSGVSLPAMAPLLQGDGSMSRHEVEVELAQTFGPFRGGLAGQVGMAAGRLSPALDESPIRSLSDGEARYYRTQIWAACVQTETEVQVGYGRVLSAEKPAAPGSEPSDYRQIDLVVYQQIPGPRALREARLRVLMSYQGFDYDTLYDGPAGSAVSGRASRVTGGLDITF